MRFSLRLMLAILSIGCALTGFAQLPDPMTGGKNGGPIDILFLHGRMEVGFDQQLPLEEIYANKLKAMGFRLTEASDFQPLTLEYLQQFSCVVYINPSPAGSCSYFNPTNWRGGMHMLTVAENMQVLQHYVEAGGGLLINPALEEAGSRRIEALKTFLSPYGMDIECAQVRDPDHAFVADKVLNTFPLYYAWTERITPHPATAGVKRVYYPTHVMRWDDNYTTLPLFPRDAAWTTLVQAMPGSVSAWVRGGIYDPAQKWFSVNGREAPAIVAVRDFGKGRVAVVGISHFHLFYRPYSKEKTFWEDYYGLTNGMLLETGDGKTPSDLGRLLSNIYCWVAEPAVKAGMGGYRPDTGIKLAPAPTPTVDNVSAVWADKDPMVTGQIRPMKILLGAHSSYSDGNGTVAEYAAAAKSAGYDVVCFTETFEKLVPAKWTQFVAECERYSDEKVALLPGVDIEDALGNRFLLVGLRQRMREHLLTEDGKQLLWTGHMLLGMGDVLPVAARPQRMATLRDNGMLPPDLYSHCPGIALATYHDGKQVDDGLFAYQWHLFNASMPIPVAIHEVYTPNELTGAAKTGLQCYVNADTPAHTAFYFKQGAESFGGNPMRYYVSSGPLVDSCVMDDWASPHWAVALKAHDASPITEALVYDQRGLYRRYTPDATEAQAQWHGDLGAQHWFLVELKDAAGGAAYLSPIRTLPNQNFIRCGDRQNWFGNIHYNLLSYTGRMRTMPNIATLEVSGADLLAPLCPRLQLIYAGPGYTITDYLLDMTLRPGAPEPGADNAPIFNALPNEAFSGRVRFIFHRDLAATAWTPNYQQAVVTLTLKKDIIAKGDVWPIIGRTSPKAPFIYTDAAGQRVAGIIPENGYIDLPKGGAAGDIIALTPLRVSGKGLVGLSGPGDGGVVKAGMSFQGSFVKVNAIELDAIRKSMGFDGATPYTVTVTQGKLVEIAMGLVFQGKDGGISGHLKGGVMPVWWAGAPAVELRLPGTNPRWPVGLWRSDGSLQAYDIFEGMAMGKLNVAKDCDFYFGNLLVATNPKLNLAFSAEWTKDGAVIEVNNPTDKPISATVSSPKAINDRIAIHQKVKAPVGATIYVKVGK